MAKEQARRKAEQELEELNAATKVSSERRVLPFRVAICRGRQMGVVMPGVLSEERRNWGRDCDSLLIVLSCAN